MPTNGASHSSHRAIDPRLIEAMRLHAKGDNEGAYAHYKVLLEALPENADAHYNMAVLCLQRQSFEEALAHARQAFSLAPNEVRFGLLLAKLQTQNGAVDDAIATLAAFLDRPLMDKQVLQDFFSLCISNNRFEQALRPALRMLDASPDDMHAHTLMLSLYEHLGRYQEALPHFAKMLTLKARQPESFFVLYFKNLNKAGDIKTAREIIDQGLELYPASEALLNCRAFSFYLEGRGDEALKIYERIGVMNPDNRYAIAMGGTMKLLLTDLEQGYEAYALRPMASDVEPHFLGYYPKWSGENLSGKKLLLWGEQGIGDVIMFCGMVPWLLKQKARLTALIPHKLFDLLRKSFPDVQFYSSFSIIAPNQFDYHLPMGALLPHARTEYVPADNPPYIKADKQKAIMLRERYTAGGKKRIIGISWHTTNEEVGFARNIPLADFAALFALADIQWVSLQYGDHAEEIAAVNCQFPGALLVDHEIDAFNAVDDFAAQLSALDGIVTIDNFTIHLAGALGVPATLLLSTMPDWRWGLKRKDSRWYKSVVIERQTEPLEWKPVIAQVAEALRRG